MRNEARFTENMIVERLNIQYNLGLEDCKSMRLDQIAAVYPNWIVTITGIEMIFVPRYN